MFHLCMCVLCRLCVQVSLPPGTALQLDCVAYDTASRHGAGVAGEQSGAMKRTMHVQSISHWAPANIGPYSQAVQARLMPLN